MSQNIYDDDGFFAGYSRLARSLEGLAGAPEWPALQGMLPDLSGLSVVDLGCGFGWFCRWARERGAARVLGIDLSENMLARARATTADASIAYQRADLEALSLPRAGFDLAYSSLALHYIANLERLLATVRDALAPGGRFVFSVEHPIYTAPAHPGWVAAADGGKTWPVDSYLEEGPRSTDWLAKGVIKQHRTVASYVNLLIGLGFTLARLEEWGPTPAQVAERAILADERRRPPFLLVAAGR
jgi:SAM-dependent methyltransferase